MDPQQTLIFLKARHRQIEIDAGEDPDQVTDEICPFDQLRAFDSLLMPTVIRGLAKDLELTLPPGKRLKNCYVDGSGRKLTMKGVSERFCQLYATLQKAA